MSAHEAGCVDEEPPWTLRIAAYLIAWTAADAVALWLRFGAISGSSAARWFLVGAA